MTGAISQTGLPGITQAPFALSFWNPVPVVHGAETAQMQWPPGDAQIGTRAPAARAPLSIGARFLEGRFAGVAPLLASAGCDESISTFIKMDDMWRSFGVGGLVVCGIVTGIMIGVVGTACLERIAKHRRSKRHEILQATPPVRDDSKFGDARAVSGDRTPVKCPKCHGVTEYANNAVMETSPLQRDARCKNLMGCGWTGTIPVKW